MEQGAALLAFTANSSPKAVNPVSTRFRDGTHFSTEEQAAGVTQVMEIRGR
jgi:hypothetical protein